MCAEIACVNSLHVCVCVRVCDVHVCVCVCMCACVCEVCVRAHVCVCAACVCDDGVNGLCSFVLLYHHSYAKSCLNVMVQWLLRLVKLMHLSHTHVHRLLYMHL